MAVGDVFRIVLKQNLNNQNVQNVLHYRTSTQGAGDAMDALSVALVGGGSVVATLKACQSSSLQWSGHSIAQVFPLPAPLAKDYSTSQGPGGVAGAPLPAQNAVVVSRGTGLAGKSYRGRIYFAGLLSDHETDGLINTSGQSLWNNVPSVLTAGLTSGGYQFQPVLYSRLLGTFQVITTHTLRLQIRAQRRRQVGVGS